MIKYIWVFALLILESSVISGEIVVQADAPNNRRIQFLYRLPSGLNVDSRIMVLFGGRNWRAAGTLKRYGFDGLADKHNLILLSPTFRDDDYWEPEKWSGRALFEAVSILEMRYKLKSRKLFYYGYSAGGQCTMLFYAYAPERVEALALHACGVYFEARNWKKPLVPMLISCGTEDEERYVISRNFIFNYREAGGSVIWKPYSDRDHALTPEALALARQFFEDYLTGRPVEFIGEDDTGLVVPPEKMEKIMPEYRNPLTSALRTLWESKR